MDNETLDETEAEDEDVLTDEELDREDEDVVDSENE